jgi:hypothetical protein
LNIFFKAGKSEFIFSLVKFREDIFTTKFHRIIFCEPHRSTSKSTDFFQRLKNEFPTIEQHFGLPNMQLLNLEFNTLPCLILIDDLMKELLSSEAMFDLVTKQVHHNNLSVCFTLQNYYAPSKFGKSFIRNCQYRVIFYNRLDQRELNLMSSQIANSPQFFSSNFDFLYKQFPNIHSHFLLIDGQFNSSVKEFWCRTNIFPAEKGGEIRPIIFMKNPDFHSVQ